MDWMALGLALAMLTVFAGVAWAARRYGRLLPGTSAAAAIQVVGARRLDLHTTLYLIEVDGRRLLVGSGREGARLVADLTVEV